MTSSTLFARRPPDVLVIDDEPLVREALSDLLRRDGLSVADVTTVQAAMRSLGDAPTVIVVDWDMPAASGLDLCRLVRSTRDGDYIIVFTARDSSADHAAARAAGADALVSKRLPVEVVLDAVRQGRKRVAEIPRKPDSTPP